MRGGDVAELAKPDELLSLDQWTVLARSATPDGLGGGGGAGAHSVGGSSSSGNWLTTCRSGALHTRNNNENVAHCRRGHELGPLMVGLGRILIGTLRVGLGLVGISELAASKVESTGLLR